MSILLNNTFRIYKTEFLLRLASWQNELHSSSISSKFSLKGPKGYSEGENLMGKGILGDYIWPSVMLKIHSKTHRIEDMKKEYQTVIDCKRGQSVWE